VAKGVKLTPDFKLIVPLPGLTGMQVTASIIDLLMSLVDDSYKRLAPDGRSGGGAAESLAMAKKG
jgi:hypothetical protein